MLKARKANRVLKIPDEKKKTYIALGYTITDMDGNMIHEHVEPSEKLEQAEKEIQDLKEKLEEASKYAENADKKIEDLEKKNAEASESPDCFCRCYRAGGNTSPRNKENYKGIL